MKLVTIALALLMLATAAHADGKPVSKKPYSNWVWEDLGCGRKCPEQAAVREGPPGTLRSEREPPLQKAYEMARQELDRAEAAQLAGK